MRLEDRLKHSRLAHPAGEPNKTPDYILGALNMIATHDNDQLRCEAYSIPGLGTASLREEPNGTERDGMRPIRCMLYINGTVVGAADAFDQGRSMLAQACVQRMGDTRAIILATVDKIDGSLSDLGSGADVWRLGAYRIRGNTNG